MNPVGTGGVSRGVSALLILIMLVWGLNIPVVKALTGVMDFVWVGAVRLVAATAVLTACLWARDRRWPRLQRRQIGFLVLTAFMMIYANQLLFAKGMQLATATSASLVMALIPLLSLLAGVIAFRDRIPPLALVGVALGFGGVAVVVLEAPGADLVVSGLGEAIILLGLIAFVCGGLMIQRVMRDLDVLVVGWAIYVIGTGMLLLHAAIEGGWRTTAAALGESWVWWYVLYSGVIGTALSNIGWYAAIGRIGQSRASLSLYWLPIFGVGFSSLLLDEPLGWWHLLGLVMVIAGTRLGSARRPAKAPVAPGPAGPA